MNPYDDHPPQVSATPRVWLVARTGSTADPTDGPVVRDTRMRTWRPGPDGAYHSTDGWHHATWAELHSRFDLIEVLAA
ncbi:hypothetical protein [Actinophytocola sp.]|uniref:hypothetical protein n=1 Tax=Actinophytocola sp. TaxID=1872138 RepID=UPI002D7EA7DB|nr:hypothetical protein [Actinophytocola sp.]HET9143392.1 hypothetical protein [Actinophytocola sp.]